MSLIKENAVQSLCLKRDKLAVVSGIGASQSNPYKRSVSITSKAILCDFTFTTAALIMNTLINKLSNKAIDKELFERLQHIQLLADPEFNVTNKIYLLLGAVVYSALQWKAYLKQSNGNRTRDLGSRSPQY